MYRIFFGRSLRIPLLVIITFFPNVNANASQTAAYWDWNSGPHVLSLDSSISLDSVNFHLRTAIQYTADNVIINADQQITSQQGNGPQPDLTEITAIDVSGHIGAGIRVVVGDRQNPLILGSVMNKVPGDANLLAVAVEDGKGLMLSGSNLTDNNTWAPRQTVTVDQSGTLSNANPLIPNGVYSYQRIQAQSPGPGAMPPPPINYLFAENSYISINTGSNNPIIPGDYKILGPYNYYGALGSISVGAGSSVIVNSAYKNDYSNNNLAPVVLTPTILPNTFTFTDHTATFDVESDATITDATFGGVSGINPAGFGYITGSSGATLNINIKTVNGAPATSDNNFITLSNVWTNTGNIHFEDGVWKPRTDYLGTLKILTPVTITHSSIENVQTLVANNTTLILEPEADMNLANISLGFGYEDATLVISNRRASSNASSFSVPQNFLSPLNDKYGKLNIYMSSHKDLHLTSNGQGSVGGSAFTRLKLFRMGGSDLGHNTIFLEVPVYSKEVSIDTSGSILMGSNTVNMGVGGILNVIRDLDHSLYPNNIRLISNGTLIEPVIINLGAYYPAYLGSSAFTTASGLNAGAGVGNNHASLLEFQGYVTINAFSQTVVYNNISRVSKINVDGVAGNIKSTLDVHDANITVNFTPDGGVLSGATAQNFILLGATGGGEVMRTNATVQFMQPGPQDFGYNPLINWTGSWDVDNNYVINYSYDHAQINQAVQQNGSASAQAVITHLTNPQEGNITQAQAIVLGNLFNSISNEDVSSILNIAESLVIASNTQEAMETASTSAIAHIITRANSGFTSSSFQGLLTEADEGLAAGGTFADDEFKSGVWMNGFALQAVQKSYSNVPGYKAKSYGGSLGADTKVSDTLLIGAAWTYTDSIMKHGNNRSGNKARLDNNILSLYSLINFSETWLLHSSASIGFGKTKSQIVRYAGLKLSISGAKYDTRSYAVNLQLSRMINFADKFVLEPVAGLTYNRFDDQAYTERGGVLNWTVAKKHSRSLESLVGASVATVFTHNEYVIKPNVSAYAHINVMNKQDAVHTSLDGIAGGVALPAQSASAVWYSAGAGFTLFKGPMEFGASYEAQLDKKYIGHQGSFKARWNF